MAGENLFSAIPEEREPPTRIGRRIVAAPKKRKKFSPSGVAQHVLFLGGLLSVTCGCAMIYLPLGPIVGGLLLVGLAMLISAERDGSSS